MGFMRNRVAGRFPLLTRLGDVALVGNAGIRFASRRGWISEDLASKVGAQSSSGGSKLSVSELALVGAAAARLLKAGASRRSKT